MTVCSQELLNLCARHRPFHRQNGRLIDEEATFPSSNLPSTTRIIVTIHDKLAVSTSDFSSSTGTLDLAQHSNSENSDGCLEGRQPPSTAAENGAPLRPVALLMLENPLLVSTWFLTILVCIPLRYCKGYENPLGISLLLATWALLQALQNRIKSQLPRQKLRTALSVICNPVLWTAMTLLAYAAAESHRSSRPIQMVLSTLERNTTFTDLIMQRSHFDNKALISPLLSSRESVSTDYVTDASPGVAAGDVANAMLSAGLVCWGLKLWEYRRRLLSTAGFTILVVSCLAALANVVLGPLLAKAILGPQSQPGYDLAFVARSVTLALGGPAVARLGGDVGLNAAMVVMNGIMCQMLLGLGVGEWLRRSLDLFGARVEDFYDYKAIWRRQPQRVDVQTSSATIITGKAPEPDATSRDSKHSSALTLCGVAEKSTEEVITSQEGKTNSSLMLGETTVSPSYSHDTTELTSTKSESTATIASGVTVGINAAAMGTAHLYETGSDAAPYSALAMTVFGIATVGFTMVPQLAVWIVDKVQ